MSVYCAGLYLSCVGVLVVVVVSVLSLFLCVVVLAGGGGLLCRWFLAGLVLAVSGAGVLCGCRCIVGLSVPVLVRVCVPGLVVCVACVPARYLAGCRLSWPGCGVVTCAVRVLWACSCCCSGVGCILVWFLWLTWALVYVFLVLSCW